MGALRMSVLRLGLAQNGRRPRDPAVTALLWKAGFGAARPGLKGQGPKAGPSRWVGGRALWRQSETGFPAKRRGCSLAAALVWACLALSLPGLFAAPAQAGVVFEEIPQGHGGTGKSFKVQIFVNPGGTPNVTATNATVTVAAVGNSNHVFRITVTPTSDSDISLKVPGARKRVIRGPDGDARVKNMYIQGAPESEKDIYLDFRYPKRSYYLSKRAFGLSLHVETHSNAKICIFDDSSGGRCFDDRKTASMILSQDSRRDHKDRTRTWTVRVASMDGTGATTYNVIIGDGPVIPPRALDCTFDVFDDEIAPEGLTVTPDLGVVESIDTKGCRRYEITLNDPPIRIENHQFRGTVIEMEAHLKQAYIDAGAALFLDWADFYEGRNYSMPLADARPELRLDETILYLRMRLPRGTVSESSVARTSGNGTYEHLTYPIKVVRTRGGGSGGTGKHVAGQPLTAEFENMPTSHDGSTAFTFRLAFSDDVDIEPAEMRDHALTVTDGTVTGASRVDGRSDLWEFTVEPAGSQSVGILVPQGRACTEQGGLCTSDGRTLSGAKTAQTIPYAGSGWSSSRAPADSSALPTLSIADDDAQEGPGAFLRFRIRLSEASDDPVTFNIATSDGTAIAGTDYIAKNRSKTIKAGRTTAWFKIHVIDDSHDEGDETFTVTLSNASGATIADGTATGTIKNSDAMPQAWLARFGRTAADQVLDAVEGRMGAARTPGVEVAVAGQRLGGAVPDAVALEKREAEAGLDALADWLQGGERDDAIGFETRALTARELLTGSSFAWTGGSAEGGFGALWGRGAVTRFDGRADDLTLDGEVTSAMLGADWTLGRGSAGLVVSHSRGEGGFRSEAGDGAVESTLTGLYPWGRYALGERLTAWGVAGYGSGELVLTPDGMDPIETDMALAMAALGGRGVLARPSGDGGLEVAATSDAMVVRTTSDELRSGGGSLAASEADVTRLRLGLEGTWHGLGTAGRSTFVPTLELGVRHDGGDAEAGFGADIGVGLSWTDRALGIEAALRARGLLTHAAEGFRERGFAGTLAWDPAPESERGPSLRISQAVGAEASGGLDALLRPAAARALAADDHGDGLRRRRLEARLGYGLSSFGGRYTATPEIGIGFSDAAREYIYGWRLEGSGHEGFELRFEGARVDPANDDPPEYRLGVRMTARW